MSPRFDMGGLSVEDPRFVAAVDMVGRTGAKHFQIRYCEEETPTIWIAAAGWKDGAWETAAAMDPLTAVFRLCDQIVDGGTCTHCHRPTGFNKDFEPLPLGNVVCYYSWDPELQTFRRSCEGQT